MLRPGEPHLAYLDALPAGLRKTRDMVAMTVCRDDHVDPGCIGAGVSRIVPQLLEHCRHGHSRCLRNGTTVEEHTPGALSRGKRDEKAVTEAHIIHAHGDLRVSTRTRATTSGRLGRTRTSLRRGHNCSPHV